MRRLVGAITADNAVNMFAAMPVIFSGKLHRLLDGFEGKMTNAKWAAITKTSSDTALRDIGDLVQRGILVREPGGGRSTSYALTDLTGTRD